MIWAELRGRRLIAFGENGAACLVLALAVLFVGWSFCPELLSPTFQMSDLTLHLSLLESMAAALKDGASRFDFWYPNSPFGYPLFRIYQHLPHLIIYEIFRVGSGAWPLESLLRWTTCALACSFPLAIYLALRLTDFRRLPAALTALAAVLLAETGDYGLGLHNYSWGSGGIITQLWAAVFLFPALAFGQRFILGERSSSCRSLGDLTGALIFLFLACGSHLAVAFILLVALASLVFLALLFANDRHARWGIAGRSALLFCLALIACAYQWVYLISDREYINQSIHEPRWKFASHGIDWVLSNFWNGDLFDAGRFPSLSLLVLLGMACAGLAFTKTVTTLARRAPVQEAAVRKIFYLFGFILGLSLLSGWDIWGALFAQAPLLSVLHLHRMIVMAQLFGVFLVAVAFEFLQDLFSKRWQALYAALALVFLLPGVFEREQRFELAHGWLAEALAAKEHDQDLARLLAKLHTLPKGWIYPGFEATWSRELLVGKQIALRHVLLTEGFPTIGQLYHSNALAGDVTFDFHPELAWQYQALGVRYVIAPSEWQAPEFLSRLGRYGRFALYENGAVRRIQVVRPVFRISDSESARSLAEAMRHWFLTSLAERGLVGVADSSAALPTLVELMNSAPQWESESQTKVLRDDGWQDASLSARVKCGAADLVVGKVSFHPNWQVRIDGEPSRTMLVTPGFVAAACPPGEHEVVFQYVGSRLRGLLFGAGCLVQAALLVLWLSKRTHEG